MSYSQQNFKRCIDLISARQNRVNAFQTCRKIRRLQSFLKNRIQSSSLTSDDQLNRNSLIFSYLYALRTTATDAEECVLSLLIDHELRTSNISAITLVGDIIHSGLLSMVVQYLCTDHEQSAANACKIIDTIVAHGDAGQFEQLLHCNIIQNMLLLLQRCPHEHQINSVIRFLSRLICSYSSASHKHVYEAIEIELLTRISGLLATIGIKDSTAASISVLLSTIVGQTEPSIEFTQHALPVFKHLFERFEHNKAICNTNLKTIVSLTDGYGSYKRANAVVEHADLSLILMKLIGNDDKHLQLLALQIFGNITRGFDENVQWLLENNLLAHLKTVLHAPHSTQIVIQKILEILSNIAGGHTNDVQSIIDAGLIQSLFNIMYSADCVSQKCAVSVVLNMTQRGRLDQIECIIEYGLLQALCHLLKNIDVDVDVVDITLETIGNILRDFRQHNFFKTICSYIDKCDGFVNMELMQYHENEDISKMAFELTENFFCHANNVNFTIKLNKSSLLESF